MFIMYWTILYEMIVHGARIKRGGMVYPLRACIRQVDPMRVYIFVISNLNAQKSEHDLGAFIG